MKIFFQIRWRHLLLLASLCLVSGCSASFLSLQNAFAKMTGDAQYFTQKDIKKYVGQYRLLRITVRDIEENYPVDFSAYSSVPVVIDRRRSLVFEGIRTELSLNSNLSYLIIDTNHRCKFSWAMEPSNKDVDIVRSSLGRFRLAGEVTEYGCLRHNNGATVPSGLIPLNDVVFRKYGPYLVFEGREAGQEVTLYYVKVDKLENHQYAKAVP